MNLLFNKNVTLRKVRPARKAGRETVSGAKLSSVTKKKKSARDSAEKKALSALCKLVGFSAAFFCRTAPFFFGVLRQNAPRRRLMVGLHRRI